MPDNFLSLEIGLVSLSNGILNFVSYLKPNPLLERNSSGII